ncbi:MAG: Bifunctional molybdenum cofactor biosynthesis protein MoaC/MogA [candidate division Zixibacteria bacterium RBG-1]|nr:MAG: Bifunctional molybdenum cofactor biosynthesis protein MoaC/MogA [candidate division Zixibacteria bacterium RBG-1]OGC86276.1 MAG: bifunctional molybdenum cofactor biosynthesis protein MoaC/MoaB [candidate division Zixibacteria bacterium RBG_19FT_COMBO_42_43]
MKDVSNKFESLRTAGAIARVWAKPETLSLIRENKVPKGNVIEIAKTAGILAAKRTSELIPLCHPIPLDYVEMEISVTKEEMVVESSVKAVWKTGVEMEALTAVTVAALTIYDMLKPLDDSIEIQSIKLSRKTGGITDFIESFQPPLKAAVLVLSTSTFEGKRKDKSGQIIVERLKEQPIAVVKYEILPDDEEKIRAELLNLVEKEKVDLIVTTGGAGLGPSDVTVEATRKVIEKEVPGIVEAARAFGQKRTPYSMLSRGLAGVKGKTLIINLPGSSNGVRESLDCFLPAVLHAFKMIWGGGHKE